MEHRWDIYKVNWKNKANRLTATGHRSPKGAEPPAVVDKTFFFHTKTKSRSNHFSSGKSKIWKTISVFENLTVDKGLIISEFFWKLKLLMISLIKSLWPLFMDGGSTVSRLQSYYEETFYFLPFISQEFLVLNWSILEGWKAELTLKPPSGFEPGTPGLGINH